MATHFELNINPQMDQDIATLRNADQNLDEAKGSIDRLKQLGSGMKGETGQAIISKAEELEKLIAELKQNIASDIEAIRKAQQEYKEKDLEEAQRIAGM